MKHALRIIILAVLVSVMCIEVNSAPPLQRPMATPLSKK